MAKPKLTEEEALRIKQEWDLKFAAARNDLYTFCYEFLGNHLLIPRVHGPLCNFIEHPVLALDGIVKGPNELYGNDYEGPEEGSFVRETVSRKNVTDQLLLLPRSSFKTTIIGIGLPLWLLCRNPDWTIAIVGKSDDKSIATLNAIDDHINNNAILKRYFGSVLSQNKDKNTRWNLREKFIGGRTKVGERAPSLWASSVGSFAPSYHFNAIIIDDPIDDKTVTSDELTTKVDSFMDSVVPILDKPRLRYVVGTRWGLMDIYYKLMQMRYKVGWKESPVFDRYIRSVYNPDGSLWFPEKFNEEEIAKIKAQCRTSYIFASQYLMKPIPQGEQHLEIDKVDLYTDGEHPKRDSMFVVVGVDPADPDASGDSYWAIWAMGVDGDRHYWDLETVKAKKKASEVVKEIIRICMKWKADTLLVERTIISKTFIDAVLKNEIDRSNLKVRLVTDSPRSRSKVDRILNVENALGSVISQGRMHIRKNNPSLAVEFESFPARDASWDLLDIGSYITQFVGGTRFYPRKIVLEDKMRYEDPETMRVAKYEEESMKSIQRESRNRLRRLRLRAAGW